MVHLLGRVCVAVDHSVSRDDHKRVWSGKENIAKLGFFVLVFVTHVSAVGPQARVLIHICNQAGVGENCSFLTCLGCLTHKQNQSSQHLMCPGQGKMVLMAIIVKKCIITTGV